MEHGSRDTDCHGFLLRAEKAYRLANGFLANGFKMRDNGLILSLPQIGFFPRLLTTRVQARWGFAETRSTNQNPLETQKRVKNQSSAVTPIGRD